ncbi:hypothetical protein, partial [Klebsiella pneumoniae]|uniref:hypothetical protein n=1 Tax=Klebsiella pneumoniae TaxID=573 RepID=UPI001C6FE244
RPFQQVASFYNEGFLAGLQGKLKEHQCSEHCRRRYTRNDIVGVKRSLGRSSGDSLISVRWAAKPLPRTLNQALKITHD